MTVVLNAGLLAAVFAALGLLGTALFRLDAKIDQFEARMDGGFARLDAKIDALAARMEARFDRVEARLAAVEQR